MVVTVRYAVFGAFGGAHLSEVQEEQSAYVFEHVHSSASFPLPVVVKLLEQHMWLSVGERLCMQGVRQRVLQSLF